MFSSSQTRTAKLPKTSVRNAYISRQEALLVHLHIGAVLVARERQVVVSIRRIDADLEPAAVAGAEAARGRQVAAVDVAEVEPAGDQVGLLPVGELAVEVLVGGGGAGEWQALLVLVVVVGRRDGNVEAVGVLGAAGTFLFPTGRIK